MKRSRQDLARALAERSPLTEGQAQDELDRVVHGIVTSLRQGRRAEMPGVGPLTAKGPTAANGAPRKTSAARNPAATSAKRKPGS